MSIQPELKTVLKRLKLSPMLPTLPDRLAYARKEKLDYAQHLELVLSDAVERRDQLLQTSARSRAGNSCDRELRGCISPVLRTLADSALRKLSSQAASACCDLLIARLTRSPSRFTCNRGVEEWIAVFDEPVLGRS